MFCLLYIVKLNNIKKQQQPQQPLQQLQQHDHNRQDSVSSEKQWGSFGGFQWEGPSIFEEENTSRLSNHPTTMDPIFRQRSLSFSMGQDPTFFGYDDYSTRNNSLLAPTLEEDENEQQHINLNSRLHHSMDDAYFRSRSQSISSAFGLYSPSSSTNSSSSSYWTTRHSSLGFIHPTSLVDKEQQRLHFTDYSFPEIIPNGPQ